MKGCVLFTIVWFLSSIEAGAASTIAPTEISSSTKPFSSFMTTETSSASVTMETTSTSITTITEASSDSMTTTTEASSNSMTTTTEASSTSMTTSTEASNASMATITEASSTSMTTVTETSRDSMATTTETSSAAMTMATEASRDPMTTTTEAFSNSMTMVTETSSISITTNPTPPNATTEGVQTTPGLPSCADHPCKYAAACIDLFQSFLCRCPYGFYYMNKSGCQQGKVFPGEFTLMQQYHQDMENIQSEVYAGFYHNISNIFSDIFKDEKSYQETIIISIKPSTQASKRLRRAEAASNINVTLINLFDINTSVTLEVWEKKVNSSNEIKFDRSVSQCAVYGCDGKTTTCSEAIGDSHPTCECHSGLAKKDPEDKACSLCESTACSPEKNQYCSMTAENVPVCRCQSGFKKEGDSCQACAFGYSGEDCKEVYLAALVGVSVACGAVIIILIGVLIYKVTRRNKESSLERRSLLQNDYSLTRETTKNGSYSNPTVKQRMFPRVQTGKPEGVTRTATANQGGNFHEAGTTNKAYVPERDYDDDNNSWLEMSSRDRF